MANRLANETSPYLLQHAENPVDWYPWGDEALSRARAEDKPVLVSIGYAACHWCHVMERESFEDPQTAALMNEHFVCVKVDREERPDVDAIYMDAVQAMTGHGGWPLNAFLTPDGVPFFAGTYFPPQPRHGMPSWPQVLQGVARAWEDQRAEIAQASSRMVERLRASATLQARGEREMALHTLRRMASGGMYDQVGGGFARYSVDAHWIVPHFEKMLYDNALLARAYLHAWQVSGEALFERVTTETLDWALRELRQEEGGFASALDADSEGVEGKFYVWTPEQVREALPEDLAPSALQHFAIQPGGNFEGASIPVRATPDPERLDEIKAGLLAAREQRVRPGLDDKRLTAWNALMISALAEAGAVLGRGDYV